MIHIIGPESTTEYKAALQMIDMITETWPGLETSSHNNLYIYPSAKCYGEKNQDVDIFCILSTNRTISFKSQNWGTVDFRSFFLAIELKDSRPRDVKFFGNQVQIRYHDRWADISEQSFGQVHSLRNYIKRHKLIAPYIRNLIWLRNVPKSQAPKNINNIIYEDSSWTDLLNILVELKGDKLWSRGNGILEFNDNTKNLRLRPIIDLFGEVIQPSELDRKKMEKISKRLLSDQKYSKNFGKQLLIFRGRGGTGKTARLLQLAHDLYCDEDARVLILTYNKALVADLRRLLTLMGNNEGLARKSIQVQTVHKYLRDFMISMGIISKQEREFIKKYDNFKMRTLEYLNTDTITKEDLENLIKVKNSAFTWDYVFIDEAQDWPSDEKEILYSVYSHNNFVIADGVDQLVRGNMALDWKQHLEKSEYQVVPLRQSIRLKSGLCKFTRKFAEELGLPNWELKPNNEIHGGRVVVIKGQYSSNSKMHEELLSYANEHNNSPVDLLFCVPPQLVKKDENNNSYSLVSKCFEEWGHQVWDGASEDVRTSYPKKLEELRIVQYDSCRGLEGWVVVNFALDKFYDHKFDKYEATTEEEQDLFFDRDQKAKEFALQWLMIPLTRAIDTLVIQITDEEHLVSRALRECKQALGDLVEWKEI